MSINKRRDALSVRYLGGKKLMAKYILPVILQNRVSEAQWYVEPFCGSCAVIEHVRGRRIANDANRYIIAMLEAIQKGWTPPDSGSEEFYKQVRYNKGAYCNALVGFVGFGCSFGGNFFNSYGRDLKNTNYADRLKRMVLLQKPKLKNTIFTSMDYRNLPLPANAIIYCDPPYQNTESYATKHSGIAAFNHEEFWQWVREKTVMGFDVYVSEFTAPPDFISVWSRHRKSTYARNVATKVYTEHIFKYDFNDNAKCNHALF
jgi:Site-specific DNA methylase